jgi:hypothetical protein
MSTAGDGSRDCRPAHEYLRLVRVLVAISMRARRGLWRDWLRSALQGSAWMNRHESWAMPATTRSKFPGPVSRPARVGFIASGDALNHGAIIPRDLFRRILQKIDRIRSERPAQCCHSTPPHVLTGAMLPLYAAARVDQRENCARCPTEWADFCFRRRNPGLGAGRDGPRTKYGVLRFPVVSGGSILSPRWLDRPLIWGM